MHIGIELLVQFVVSDFAPPIYSRALLLYSCYLFSPWCLLLLWTLGDSHTFIRELKINLGRIWIHSSPPLIQIASGLVKSTLILINKKEENISLALCLCFAFSLDTLICAAHPSANFFFFHFSPFVLVWKNAKNVNAINDYTFHGKNQCPIIPFELSATCAPFQKNFLSQFFSGDNRML